MCSRLHYVCKRVVLLPKHLTAGDVYEEIARRWNKTYEQNIPLEDGLNLVLSFYPGHMDMRFSMNGIPTCTYNSVALFQTEKALKVHVTTSKPSFILQSLWNAVITYEFKDHSIFLTYEKTVTSTLPSPLDEWSLAVMESQQRRATPHVAQTEVDVLVSLFGLK
jgi:hypothetical protein